MGTKNVGSLFSTCLLATLAAACSTGAAQSSSTGNNANKSASTTASSNANAVGGPGATSQSGSSGSTGPTLGSSTDGTETESGDSTTTNTDTNGGNAGSGSGATGGTGSSVSTATTYPATPDGWCQAAAQTQLVKSAKHADAFAALCANGKATAFFTSTLVNSAYAGTGTPSIQNINPMSDSGGVVNAFFGTALKLPISSAEEFNKVAPRQGTVANQEALLTQQGQTPGNVTVTPEAHNADFGWVRGWSIELPSSQTVLVVNITNDYTFTADHYQLGSGLYMYASTTTAVTSSSTVRDYELLAAGLDINGTGYLVSAVRLAASDHGLASTAESTLTGDAQSQAKQTYDDAVGQ